jgi:TonB family protein
MMRDDKGKTGMQPKKNLILFILISFAIHMAMLSLTGFINMQGKSPREEVLAIHLNDPPENTNQSPEGKEEPKTAQSTVKKNTASHRSKREATVDLGSIDLRYTPYLKKIKQKIETIWKYPKLAFEKEGEGITVVKFSIDRSGALVASGIVTSSGSIFLDQGTIDVVRSAAPYEPFPPDIDLSQLNIIARFQYRLAE